MPAEIDGTTAMRWGDPRNWLRFDQVSPFDKIGWFPTPKAGILVVDLDGCRNKETGEIHPLCLRWIQQSRSYAEVSPSGTGVKFYLRGTLVNNKPLITRAVPWANPDDPDGHYGIEIYAEKHFITVTGHILPGSPSEINATPEVLNDLLVRFSPAPKARKNGSAESADFYESFVREQLEVVESLPDGDLIVCPWASSHSTPGDTARIWKDPPYTFHCFHAHCANRVWRDVRLFYDPDAYKSQQNGTEQTKAPIKFLYASEVKPEPVDYHWKKRLARGMLTLLVGDPGLGKGLVCACIAAETTKAHGLLPDGKALQSGGVVIMSPEDSYKHTIVPRLIAAGADLTKIILLSEVQAVDANGKPYPRPISFPDDADILKQAIIECKASLAIIDPVLAMIDSRHDSHKDQESRAALSRVLSVAEQTNCALLGIFHLNKNTNSNVLYRSGASIAWIAMARIGLFLVPDPDNLENGRVLVNHKNNLAAKATSLRLSIEQTQDEIAYVKWNGASSYTEHELLNQSIISDNRASDKEAGLMAVLAGSERAMTAAEVHENLQTGQTFEALSKMLERKVADGSIMRVARGLYTYKDNPAYPQQKKTTSQSDVGSVGNVGTETELPQSASNGHAAITEESLKHSDISDIPDMVPIKVLDTGLGLCDICHWNPAESIWMSGKKYCRACRNKEMAR